MANRLTSNEYCETSKHVLIILTFNELVAIDLWKEDISLEWRISYIIFTLPFDIP